MNNLDLIDEFNDVLCKSDEVVDVDVMVSALDEYLHAVPGRKSDMPNYVSLKPRYRIPVLHLANAIIYRGYIPQPLTQADYNAYHPEERIMSDGSKPRKADFAIYFFFLESAVEYLLFKRCLKRNGSVSNSSN